MGFLNEKYLLGGETSFALFSAVKGLPVVDAHNHADVGEIARDANYSDPWQVFAATDHYVWEMLRKRGVDEKFITGGATPKEKWLKMGEVFPEIVGNPVYEWIHLDLKRMLGIDELLGPDSALKIWEKASAAFAQDSMRPRAILKAMNVEVMCSTDDPADLLAEHDAVEKAAGKRLVRPTWRPDKYMNIHLPTWKASLEKLEKRFGRKLDSLDALEGALKESHDYFASKGCVATDHGLLKPFSPDVARADADAIMKKAYAGKPLTKAECETYSGYILGYCAGLNSAKGWVTQLHIGAVRDIRDVLFRTLGPDSGGDVSDHMIDIVHPLGRLLNKYDGSLKSVLYCLDAGHQASLATVARAFGGNVRLGSAWWLNDTPIGMRRQLEYIGSVDLLYNFAGMVSDSRKILSYGSRFEMFRRVLCDVVGGMVERGQIPYKLSEKLVERMCYSGPKEFFGL